MWDKVKWALLGVAVSAVALLVAFLTKRKPAVVQAEAKEKIFVSSLASANQQLQALETSATKDTQAVADATRAVEQAEKRLDTHLTAQGLTQKQIAERFRMLKTLLIVLTAGSINIFSATASAEEVQIWHPEVLKHQGIEGLWFPPEETERLLGLAEREVSLRSVVDKQAVLIAALRVQVRTATTSQSLLRTSRDEAIARGDRWKQDVDAARDQCARPFYESPVLSFLGGVFAGGAAATSMCHALPR